MKQIPKHLQKLNKLVEFVCAFASLGSLVWTLLEVTRPACLSLPNGCPNSSWDFVLLLVALGFWAVGFTGLLLSQPLSNTFFFFLSATTLMVGFFSGLGNDLAGRLFYIFLSWLAPVLFHFHLDWAMLPRRRIEKTLLNFFFTLACAWSIPFIFFSIKSLQAEGWFSYLRLGVRYTFSLSLIVLLILLIDRFRKSDHPTTFYRIRLISSGSVLAFAPLLLLSLLPSLFGMAFVPYEVNFTWLLFIPLSYGYSIIGHKFAKSEKLLFKLIVYYLAAVMFVSGYLIIGKIIGVFMPAWTNFWAWAIAGLSLVIVFLVGRLSQIIRRMVYWMLYGNEKNHLELLTQMADSLALVLDRERLSRILVDELYAIVPLTGSALFVKTGTNRFDLQGFAGFAWYLPTGIQLPVDGSLISYFKDNGPILGNVLVRKELAQKVLAPEEQQLLALQDIELWIPLKSGNELYGLLLVGYKIERDLVSSGGSQVWPILAHHAGIAAHNVLLAEDLQVNRNELAKAHQQLLYAREQERQLLARDLHDNVIQQLLGISYQVVTLRGSFLASKKSGNQNSGELEPEFVELRQEILGVITQLREMIGELRPAGLEEFGLGRALEGFVNKMRYQSGSALPRTELSVEINSKELPNAVEICLFRVSQEALRNAFMHANAQQIKLQIFKNGSEIILTIDDDGCGFAIPNRMTEFTQTNHYGLIGIAERVAWVNGKLSIMSKPDQGTHISVQIPLYKESEGAQ